MKIDVLMFTKVIASLLKSGLILQDALEIAQNILKQKKDREFVKEIYSGIKNGNSLSSEISKYEYRFGKLYVSLLKIGEESGKLCEVFEKLEEYYRAKKERREKMIQSLVYPIVVLSTSILVILICSVFVFPKLEVIFEAFGESSEELEKRISLMRNMLRVSGFFMFFFAVLIYFFFMMCKKNEKLKYLVDCFLIKLPVVGKEIIFNQTYDFSFSMKLLSSTFYPFSESLRLSSSVVSNLCYRKSVNNVYEKTVKGYDVAGNFENEKIFPSYLTSWIKLSQQNGNFNESFNEIYEYFKYESEASASKLSTAAEPFFILITGLIVVLMIAQFVLPVFKLMGTL